MAGLSFIGDDFCYADICASTEADNTEANQQNILPKNPIESAKTWSLVIRYDFNDRWEHESECAQAHGTNQCDEWSKCWNGNGHNNAENLKMEIFSINFSSNRTVSLIRAYN